MTSVSKKNKTDKRKHWGRDGKFLKYVFKLKGLNFFNASMRKKINKITEDKL